MKRTPEEVIYQTVASNLNWSWRVCWGDEEKSASSERLSPDVHLLRARHTYTSRVHFSIREKLSETRPVSFEATKSFIFAYQMGGTAYRRGTFPPTVNQASLSTYIWRLSTRSGIRVSRPVINTSNPQLAHWIVWNTHKANIYLYSDQYEVVLNSLFSC